MKRILKGLQDLTSHGKCLPEKTPLEVDPKTGPAKNEVFWLCNYS